MRIALTGGASGIGAATVARLRKAGHEVWVFDFAEPPLADRWIATDLGDPGSVDAAVSAAETRFDALINNAGLPPREGRAVDILAVNFLGLRRFLSGMLERLAPGGAIVNTASRAGAGWRDNLDEVRALMAVSDRAALADLVAARGIDHVRAYNLSKEAVIVLTLAGAAPMAARGLRMNAVSPAAVSTGILDDFVAAFGPRVARNLERVGRPGTPQEVAEVIAFLAGPESGWLRGVDIAIDGGMGAMAMAEALELPDPFAP